MYPFRKTTRLLARHAIRKALVNRDFIGVESSTLKVEEIVFNIHGVSKRVGCIGVKTNDVLCIAINPFP